MKSGVGNRVAAVGYPRSHEEIIGNGFRTEFGSKLGEELAEIFAGSGDAAFHRADVDSECTRDVFVGEIQNVAHGENLAMTCIQFFHTS